MPRIHLTPLRTAVAGLVAVGAIFTVTLGTASAAGHARPAAAACTAADPCTHTGSQGDVDRGTTDGWYDGKTVDFTYTKNYFCSAPPSSSAASYCEAGADDQRSPVRGRVDPLYVVTPVGFTPSSDTLQCPTSGLCIDHPHDIDLSRVFGSSAADAALPPHSHVVTTNNSGVPEWWRIVVVGVTNQAAWDSLVSGKSIDSVRSCQKAGACTADIASNLFLFFAVGPQDAGADTPNL